jgi:DNA processing protein
MRFINVSSVKIKIFSKKICKKVLTNEKNSAIHSNMRVREENFLWMILNALPHIGPMTFRRLYEHFKGKISDIFSASQKYLASIEGVSCTVAEHIAHWENYFDLDREQQQLIAINSQFITQKDENYPPLLRKIDDAPIGLYVKGNRDLNRNNFIAIVGMRKATVNGLKNAHHFAYELASLGFTIVSGMALGIDGAAHEGALAAGGKTVAVLGSGIDVIYPREHKKLYGRIAENGSILSEFFLGKSVDRMTFPIRNRVIAGMCSHVIVIESHVDGGSMITANMANEYGRNVMAVPGGTEQSTSFGCHELIRDGAALVGCMDHILEELNYSRQQFLDFEEPKAVVRVELADPVERRVIDFLVGKNGVSLDEISEHLETPVHHLISRMQLLELRQLVRCDSFGHYVCCKN